MQDLHWHQQQASLSRSSPLSWNYQGPIQLLCYILLRCETQSVDGRRIRKIPSLRKTEEFASNIKTALQEMFPVNNSKYLLIKSPRYLEGRPIVFKTSPISTSKLGHVPILCPIYPTLALKWSLRWLGWRTIFVFTTFSPFQCRGGSFTLRS